MGQCAPHSRGRAKECPRARPLPSSRTLRRTGRGKHRLVSPSRNDEAHEGNACKTKLAACGDGREIGSRSTGNAIGREGENRGAARFVARRLEVNARTILKEKRHVTLNTAPLADSHRSYPHHMLGANPGA